VTTGAERLPSGAGGDHHRVNMAQDCEINGNLTGARRPRRPPPAAARTCGSVSTTRCA
jgi:hypothetical protein